MPPKTRHNLLLWFVFIIILQTSLLGFLIAGPSDWRVYIRNVMFSHIYSDKDLSDEVALNKAVASRFVRDTVQDNYLPFLNAKAVQELKNYIEEFRPTDRDLAISIIQHLGNQTQSQICGIDSLGKIVHDTDRGIGCCSDFSKAWIFYALYFGMQVREVSAPNHTTVEYFDRHTKSWFWLDPFNRIEIVNESGQPYNHYQLRRQSLFDYAKFNRLDGAEKTFSPNVYHGYAPSQLALVSWRLGVNFLYIERWDERLRYLGMPKSLRQLILLTIGIQPGWLILTTDAVAFYLKTLQLLIWTILILLITMNSTFVALCARWVWRRRNRLVE
jgi:hypothetical protein